MKQIISITDKDITGLDMLSQAVPRIAVNGILYDENGKIALSYVGKYDFYTLPGGGVESGEDKHSALKREMLEETGCECEIIEELGMVSENRYQHDFTQERYYYFARVIGNKGSLNLTLEEIEENTSVFWYYLEEAFKIISEKSPDNYKRKFIQKRDLAVLEKVLISKVLSSIPGGEDFIETAVRHHH